MPQLQIVQNLLAVLDSVPDRLIEEYEPAITPRWNKYIPHKPTLRQYAFLLLDEIQEALFGGAVGGGKSDALLMAALQYVDVPHYAALLLRRTYSDLEKPGALIPRSHEWLDGTDAHWDGMNRQWRFPSGAILDFGYLDTEQDKHKYQSAAYQFIGLDELTQFKESWYRYLFSRLRKLVAQGGVPIRMRGATNPDGIGKEWVYQRFIVEGSDKGRVFIPSRLEDNPYLDAEEYEKSLRELDPITFAQLRNGDWTARAPGAFFTPGWFKIVDEAPPGIRWIRSWDFAATKNITSAYTAGAKAGIIGPDFYIADIRRLKGDPGEVEATVKQTAQLDGIGVSVYAEQEPGSGGVNTMYRYRTSVLRGYAFNPFLPKGDKLSRARPFSAAARYGHVHLVRGRWISPFLDEASAFPDGFKDQIDACSQAYTILTLNPEPSIRRL